MRYRRLIASFAGFFIVLLCIGLGYVFWDGYYLPHKPCRPISYADGDQPRLKEGRSYFYLTEDPVDEVLQFYNQRLNAVPLQNLDDNWVLGQWVRLQLGNSAYMYQCLASDINRLTQEEGCIYINETPDGTLIETILYRFEEAAFDCNDPILRP